MGVNFGVSLAFARGSKASSTLPVRLPPPFLSSENLFVAWVASTQELKPALGDLYSFDVSSTAPVACQIYETGLVPLDLGERGFPRLAAKRLEARASWALPAGHPCKRAGCPRSQPGTIILDDGGNSR